MPSNDEAVFGIPQIQCPSCQQLLDIRGKRIDKFTKQQRKRMDETTNTYSTSGSHVRDPFPTGEENPSESAEKNYVIVTCQNHHCDQYNKIKILKLPRLYTPSVKVDLSDLG